MTQTPFEVSTDTGPIVGWESGQGPALLFLHGGPGMSDYGDMLRPEVAGWRIVHYQQRGLRPSSADGPFTVEQHVADAVAVLDARGAGRAIVVGHSWGVHLALQLALAHSERVAGLVLIDGPGVTGDGGLAEMGRALAGRLLPGAPERMEQMAERMAGREPTDAEVTEQTALLWPGYFAEPATAPPWPPQMRVSVAAYTGTISSFFEHLAAGFGESVGAIKVPVIFILGARSPMPASLGEQAAALIPSAQVRVIPAAGHLPWLERPGCVADALASIRALAGNQTSQAETT
jgi:pimeloyl-ACP methyl ester carboxylesterase